MLRIRSLEEMCCNDEISRLVEQEYLSLMKEILNETGVNCPSVQEVEALPPEQTLPAFRIATSLPSGCHTCTEPGTSVEEALKSILGNRDRDTKMRSDGDSALSSNPIVPSTCHPAVSTSNSATVTEESVLGSTAASNKEISYLLAQFPSKPIDSTKAPDNKILMEETRIIKDFLKNSMFSSTNSKKTAVPPPVSTTEGSTEGQNGVQKKQLPVFAKICSKPEPREEDEDPLSRGKLRTVLKWIYRSL
ncbi:hypothetical protein NDU88_002265 [Pleurodeles waltl]|uniref:Uncharacterized protein n=1 Tax=Pleurodeles waltl TaxID=8319 RepID=A0AAV7TKP3_PLEWA|nr:hypothetical protein NDU88_002265 [Pleurodeles waltl]